MSTTWRECVCPACGKRGSFPDGDVETVECWSCHAVARLLDFGAVVIDCRWGDVRSVPVPRVNVE